jgi:hypothetical protein
VSSEGVHIALEPFEIKTILLRTASAVAGEKESAKHAVAAVPENKTE